MCRSKYASRTSASDLPTTPFHQLRPVGLKPRPRVVGHPHNTEVPTMSCFGSVLSYLFGRDETVNGHNYKVIRRVGEGGKWLHKVETMISEIWHDIQRNHWKFDRACDLIMYLNYENSYQPHHFRVFLRRFSEQTRTQLCPGEIVNSITVICISLCEPFLSLLASYPGYIPCFATLKSMGWPGYEANHCYYDGSYSVSWIF